LLLYFVNERSNYFVWYVGVCLMMRMPDRQGTKSWKTCEVQKVLWRVFELLRNDCKWIWFNWENAEIYHWLNVRKFKFKSLLNKPWDIETLEYPSKINLESLQTSCLDNSQFPLAFRFNHNKITPHLCIFDSSKYYWIIRECNTVKFSGA
jgi:hypothetical protein